MLKFKSPPPQLGAGARVFVYCRDSGGNAQSESVPQQIAEIENYCKQNGLLIVEVFKDEARSGTSTRNRKDYNRMMSLCETPDLADGIIVWSTSRLWRNEEDEIRARLFLEEKGYILHSLNEDTPTGDARYIIIAANAYTNAEKSRQTSRDTRRGLAEHVKAGYTSGGGTPPRGYKLINSVIGYYRDGRERYSSKLEIDPETAPLVQMAFKMRAEGKSLKEIMAAPCGILYRSESSFEAFFSNITYLGYGKCGDNPPVPNHHPALIDLETWQKVQEIQERNRRREPGRLSHPKRLQSPSLLSGLAVCIHCGTPIIREISGAGKSKVTGKPIRKWNAYVCGKKRNRGDWHACEGKPVSAAKADQAILDAVLNRIMTPDFVSALLDEIRQQLSQDDEIVRQEDATRQALQNCERNIANLLDAIEATNSQTAKERLRERENERARLQFELSLLEGRKAAASVEVSPEALALALDVWRGKIEASRTQNDIRALQSLLRQFVTKIELGKQTARVWYSYPINALVTPDSTVKIHSSSGPLVSTPMLPVGVKEIKAQVSVAHLSERFSYGLLQASSEAVFFCRIDAETVQNPVPCQAAREQHQHYGRRVSKKK